MGVNWLAPFKKLWPKRGKEASSAEASSSLPPSDAPQLQLLQKRLLASSEALEDIARQFGMEIIESLSSYRVPKEIYKKIPYAFVKKHTALPIKEEDGHVLFAIADPLNLEALDEARFLLGRPVRSAYSPKAAILAAIDERYNTEEGAANELLAHLDEGPESSGGDVEVFDLLDHSQRQSPVVQLLNLILTEAIQQGASDIHFDPLENGLSVRYRIDGVLQNRHLPAKDVRTQLIARIKVMAKLDIAEHRLPQDGRIKLKMGGREIDFRVSTLPVVNGERVVLRILDRGNVVLGIDKLGIPKPILEDLRRQISLPEGILLVTGPTGSGKTTTLYSALSEMNHDETNIMTIEDPVEYKLKGIAQIGVRPKIGLTFAAGLRHILRQDPDVIMIGEIRDKETAEIAIQAALTGHMVLSTLHTNDAPSAITRLVDMGIEPYLLSSCVSGVLAQRLLRQICSQCKVSYEPSEKELLELGVSQKELPGGVLYRGQGCPACYHSGYKGRHGVYEFMGIDAKIKERIVKSADAVELRLLALERGMLSLRDHGKQLVIQGITTLQEVWRVTREMEE
ncbi:MAG: gspE [Chlamydiales bacterium]|nr:gspE [Chlamydiales bacterium]